MLSEEDLLEPDDLLDVQSSHPQDLQAVIVADGYPVRLGGSPLHVVDLPFSCVSQDGVLDGPWHLLDIPDQCLVVISYKRERWHHVCGSC